MRTTEYYNLLRAKNQADLLKKRREIFARCPEIGGLYARLSKLTAHAALSGGEGNQIAECKSKINALLLENGYEPGALELRYNCEKCNDTGAVNGEYCACSIGEIKYNTFADFDLNIFPKEARPGAQKKLQFAMDYVQAYPGNACPNLIFSGATGLGKTFLLNCIAGELIKKGAGVRMLTAYDLIQSIMSRVLGKNDYDFLKTLQRADVLILDDLGSEPLIKNVTVEYMFNLINERYIHNKHTLIATNLTGTQIINTYGKRVSSRLHDAKRTVSIAFIGEDLRLIKRIPAE